jgi:hypothetical protein
VVRETILGSLNRQYQGQRSHDNPYARNNGEINNEKPITAGDENLQILPPFHSSANMGMYHIKLLWK